MRELSLLLSGQSEEVELDVAALDMATIEFPQLAVRTFLDMLDSIAFELSRKLQPSSDGAEYVARANQFLFKDLGFRGNESDYYNPRNSCLNEVLTQRTGIPITLAILYMEVSRRLGRPVRGIGLPGHFLVQYDDGQFAAYIDVFNGGKMLSAPECYDLARRTSGLEIPSDPAVLRPATKRQILLRMLNNLRAAYFRRHSFAKTVEVLNLLIDATPNSAEEYKQRGVCNVHLQRFKAAKADLEKYLALSPDALDRAEIESQLKRVRHWIAALN